MAGFYVQVKKMYYEEIFFPLKLGQLYKGRYLVYQHLALIWTPLDCEPLQTFIQP